MTMRPSRDEILSGYRRYRRSASSHRWSISAALGCYLGCLYLLVGPLYALGPNKHLRQNIHISWRTQDDAAADGMVALAQTSDGLSQPASSAKLSFTHLSVADGLSHADVRAIAQDQQGFMWFGTWLGGLNRYDGYTFRVYQHDDRDERSLNNDTVRTLFVDHTGVLWISTMGPGLERYDRDTDSFTHFRHDPHDPSSLPDNNVKAFFEDETGTLWVGTHVGLSRFDRSSGKFFTYRARADDPASFGEDIGFTRGDVIAEVNHAPVGSVAEYKRLISGLKPGQDVLFKVLRRSGSDQFDTVYLAGAVPAPEQ